MPRNTNWFMRKYAVENNKPKQICQIYKIQLYQHNKNKNDHQQPSQDNLMNNNSKNNLPSSQPIRVSKHYINPHKPIWAQFNQRQQFGYAIQPQSPISCFNNNQHYYENDYSFYQNQQKYNNDNSWQYNADPHSKWVSY